MLTNKTERTEKQKAASRLNGARSRGPVTPEGKAASIRKPIRRGALARVFLHKRESRKNFNEVLDRLNYVLQPTTDIDHLLIGKMAVAHWRTLRVWFEEKSGKQIDNGLETTFDRQFYRSFDRYLRLHPQYNPEILSEFPDPTSN